jgi:hypothetical protein
MPLMMSPIRPDVNLGMSDSYIVSLRVHYAVIQTVSLLFCAPHLLIVFADLKRIRHRVELSLMRCAALGQYQLALVDLRARR